MDIFLEVTNIESLIGISLYIFRYYTPLFRTGKDGGRWSCDYTI